MSCLPSFNFALLLLLLLLFCFVENSRQQRNVTSQQCRHSYECRGRNEICCKNVCATSCEGMYCRFGYRGQCGQDKCCFSRCRKTCQGSPCRRDQHCGKPLKCCAGICRDSCLGNACSTMHRPLRTCGYKDARRLQCCGGKCGLSCQGNPCSRNTDCGGWGTRMKCCDGKCKKSCVGSLCEERRDCHGLECCGFPGSKVCTRTCHKSDCASNDDCRERRRSMRCCGDSICRRNCLGSVCYTETFVSDCAGPNTLYCCGMGKMECRNDCRRVQCKTNADCGPSFFYCGKPNSQNISTCTENSHGMRIFIPLQG